MSGTATGGVNFGGAMKEPVRASWGARLVLMVSALLLIAMVTAILMNSRPGSPTGGGTHLSGEMQTYVDKAMPKLEKIVRKWNGGDRAAAAGLWESIGDTPASTEADFVLSKDYLEYANNVRYYVIGDGSATLKDVEESRAKAEATLADLR